MTRVHNFSAGPAALPAAVLERASAEMLDYAGTGMSVMEMSHRSKAFIDIAERAEADLIELLGVPDDYKVLFLQGGATTQFAMVPMNLLNGSVRADYVNTGSWSKKAIKEAGKYCDVNVAASSEDTSFDRNFLRRELFPLLEGRWPGLVGRLSRTARNARITSNAMAMFIEAQSGDLMNDRLKMPLHKLLELDTEMQTLILRQWLRRHEVPVLPEVNSRSPWNLLTPVPESNSKSGYFCIRF